MLTHVLSTGVSSAHGSPDVVSRKLTGEMPSVSQRLFLGLVS